MALSDLNRQAASHFGQKKDPEMGLWLGLLVILESTVGP